ncbi:MAG: zinc ABC transporter substrate-binding protein [Deltaproteobacteria bacterium]|nr:zinc ABC transporter substrate-binding protein [Deltaproteobacteria bacterium]
MAAVRRLFRVSAWLFAIIVTLGPFTLQNSLAGEPLVVYVVNYPLKYFAERIAGEHARVVFPAPKDEDPAFWRPDIEAIAAYQQADIIRRILRRLPPINRPILSFLTVQTMQNGYEKCLCHDPEWWIPPPVSKINLSGPVGSSHTPTVLRVNTWLDLSLAAKQAKAVADALGRKRPDLRTTFQRNYIALEKDLMALDRDLKQVVAKDPTKPLIGSHPVYDYLARRYRMNMKSVHWEPDELPDAAKWSELRAIMKRHPAQWMIWEGEPLKETRERLEAVGIHSLVFDPCGNTPAKGDFMLIMRQNVKNLKRAFH